MEALTIKLAFIATLALFVLISITLYGRTFEMDSNSGRHSFHAMFAIYRHIYVAIFILGCTLPLIAASTEQSAPFRLILALSAVYALFMILWLTYQYEIYQHSRRWVNGLATEPSPYTGWKYAVTLTLGVMSPILFAIGLVGLVYVQ